MKKENSKYAVIRLNRNQYFITEGDEIIVDKLDEKKVEPEVLLLVKNGKASIGKPIVKGAKVKIKIVEPEVKGKKIHVYKYRSKSKYRRKLGFRPVYTKLLIQKIS